MKSMGISDPPLATELVSSLVSDGGAPATLWACPSLLIRTSWVLTHGESFKTFSAWLFDHLV
jgi:hypothetical protein